MPFQSTVDDAIIVGAVAAVQVDVGNASASTLGSIYGILGNPTSAISAVLGSNITMAVGGGSIAANQPVQSMVRWLVDNVSSAASITALNADVGDWSARANLASLLVSLGIPDVAGKDLYTCLITDRLDSATFGLSAIETLVDDLESNIGTISNTTLADNLAATLGDFQNQTAVSRFDEIQARVAKTVVGRTSVITKAITAASDAAATALLTVGTAAVIVKSITVYAVSAAHANLTNLVINDSTAVTTFIDAVTGVRANLDTAKKQVAWTGAAYLPVAETINIDPTGTGAGALDMLLVVEYEAVADGGVLA